MSEIGLRERKKRRMYQVVSDIAIGLFSEKGFDQVSVAEVADPTASPLVVDWRAPVSRAFYQAGPRDPQGVAVRRRFGWAPGSRGHLADLTGLEDEHLAKGHHDHGSRLLAAEIERPRIGPMRDIAAIIQPEQDDLVRVGLATSLCVQGAPGTGKTAVGLHRAAYLLYTYPHRIRRGGLLVLGPGRTFLSRTWPGLLGHLGKPDAAIVRLTTGFRVPEAVVRLSNRLLRRLDVAVPEARSLRTGGELRVRATADAVATTVDVVREGLADAGPTGTRTPGAPERRRAREPLGSIGVIAAPAKPTPYDCGRRSARRASRPPGPTNPARASRCWAPRRSRALSTTMWWPWSRRPSRRRRREGCTGCTSC